MSNIQKTRTKLSDLYMLITEQAVPAEHYLDTNGHYFDTPPEIWQDQDPSPRTFLFFDKQGQIILYPERLGYNEDTGECINIGTIQFECSAFSSIMNVSVSTNPPYYKATGMRSFSFAYDGAEINKLFECVAKALLTVDGISELLDPAIDI